MRNFGAVVAMMAVVFLSSCGGKSKFDASLLEGHWVKKEFKYKDQASFAAIEENAWEIWSMVESKLTRQVMNSDVDQCDNQRPYKLEGDRLMRDATETCHKAYFVVAELTATELVLRDGVATQMRFVKIEAGEVANLLENHKKNEQAKLDKAKKEKADAEAKEKEKSKKENDKKNAHTDPNAAKKQKSDKDSKDQKPAQKVTTPDTKNNTKKNTKKDQLLKKAKKKGTVGPLDPKDPTKVQVRPLNPNVEIIEIKSLDDVLPGKVYGQLADTEEGRKMLSQLGSDTYVFEYHFKADKTLEYKEWAWETDPGELDDSAVVTCPGVWNEVEGLITVSLNCTEHMISTIFAEVKLNLGLMDVKSFLQEKGVVVNLVNNQGIKVPVVLSLVPPVVSEPAEVKPAKVAPEPTTK